VGVVEDATAELVKLRAAAENAELGKGAGTDPEILGGFGGADSAVFDRMHACLSRCAEVWRGTGSNY
jgi:hypothetical protein